MQRSAIASASRGAASLAAARSRAGHARQGEHGSMSRAVQVGIVFVDDDHVGVVEFIAWHDAELSIDLEQRDRDHQGAGELKCVGLGEERSCDIWAPPLSEADPRSMAPVSVLNRRDHRAGKRSGGMLRIADLAG